MQTEDEKMRSLARGDAKRVMIPELFFITFPFGILVYTFYTSSHFYQLFEASDWSVAALILNSQALLRLINGLFDYQKGNNTKKLLVIFLLGLLTFFYAYVLKQVLDVQVGNGKDSEHHPSSVLVCLQMGSFFVAYATFIIFGGLGEYLSRYSARLKEARARS